MGPVRLLEGLANIAIVLTLLWPVRGRIGTMLSSIPRRYALVSVTSLAVLIGAQASDEGEAIYPLTDFAMYTTSLLEEHHRFVDYTAELSSGREERVMIGQLFPAGGMYLRRRIDESVEAIAGPDSEAIDPADVATLEAMLAALARKHDALHPRDPVRRIRIWSGSVPLQDVEGPRTISRQLIYEYQPR